MKIAVLFFLAGFVLAEEDDPGNLYEKYSVTNNNDTNNFNISNSLSRVLDFYNTELLGLQWNRVKKSVGKECGRDVELYIKGLMAAEKWALKMDDASGRYTTGWFWGNHFWTGSKSLCENIAPQNHLRNDEKHVNITKRTKRNVPAEVMLNPSTAGGYTPGKITFASLPPFPIGFFMMRVNLNSSFTSEEKIINVGLCMPDNCKNNDIKLLMEETSRKSEHLSIQVTSVRSDHHDFNLWHDTTFKILVIVSCLVAICLAVGTSYDLYLENVRKSKKILTVNCSTYINPNDKHGDRTISLDMNIPDSKDKYGKCNLYKINNNNNNNVSPSEMVDNKEDSLLIAITKDLVLSFSIRVNMKHICDRSVGSDTIPVIHGLKSISMAWVILGHTCLIAFKYSDNMEYRKVVQKDFFFQTVTNGAFSVDTFFFTSGLLVSFLYFRTAAKGKLDSLGKKGLLAGSFHFFGLIFYRFARLSAPYLFVLGGVEVAMKWFNYNSIFEPPTLDHVNCPQYWWRNILYINTLFPVDEMCMLWSWYLSDDTQFYVVGAIILILATSHFKSAATLVFTFMAGSWITTAYVAYSNGHTPTSDDPLALFDKIYDKPYTRLGPYLIGMGVGWILFKTNCKIKMSKVTIVLGWVLSSACLLSLVYGLYETTLSAAAGAAYSSLSHSAWALGLAWIVIACTTGYGGYVNSILSATILYPFSRVTYCAYLIHPMVIRIMAMNMDSPLHLGKEVVAVIFLGQLVASYLLGFAVSVAFEAPVVSMLRILSRFTPKRNM